MKLFYRKSGSGPPLIILHGLYGSSDNWISIARKISDTYTVYLPDLRNHGQSPHSDDMNYNVLSDDIEDFAEEAGLKGFFLAGHSMGGKAAMSYAIKFPEKLYGLLVADISPFVTEKTEEEAYNHHKSIFEAMLSLDLGKIISRTEAEEELKRKLPDEKIAGFLLKNLQRKETKGFEWRLNIQSLFKNLHMITEGFDREKITEIQTAGFPVTFLKASDSEYIKPEDYPDIIRLFPSAEIKEIPKAGHWLHADQPEIVAGYLKEMAGGF